MFDLSYIWVLIHRLLLLPFFIFSRLSWFVYEWHEPDFYTKCVRHQISHTFSVLHFLILYFYLIYFEIFYIRLIMLLIDKVDYLFSNNKKDQMRIYFIWKLFISRLDYFDAHTHNQKTECKKAKANQNKNVFKIHYYHNHIRRARNFWTDINMVCP